MCEVAEFFATRQASDARNGRYRLVVRAEAAYDVDFAELKGQEHTKQALSNYRSANSILSSLVGDPD
jgi:hypothetical protein